MTAGRSARIRAILYAESSSATADFVVRLCDVDRVGVSHNIADGITRARMGAGVDRLEVDLWSTSMVFKAGHRIRVHVTSTSFPRWDRNPGPDGTPIVARQRIHHGGRYPSGLVLPIVPRR